MININLIPKADIPKYSPIPPQTPYIDLFVDDFIILFLYTLLVLSTVYRYDL